MHKFLLQHNNVLFLGQGLVYNCIIRNLNCQSEVVMLSRIAFTLQNSISSRKSAHILLSKTGSIYLPLCHLSQVGKLVVYPFLCIAFLI